MKSAITKKLAADRRQEERDETWRGVVNSLRLQDGCSVNACGSGASLPLVPVTTGSICLLGAGLCSHSPCFLAHLLWLLHFTEEIEAHRIWTTYPRFPKLRFKSRFTGSRIFFLNEHAPLSSMEKDRAGQYRAQCLCVTSGKGIFEENCFVLSTTQQSAVSTDLIMPAQTDLTLVMCSSTARERTISNNIFMEN